MNTKKQLIVFFILLMTNALLALVAYLLIRVDQMNLAAASMPSTVSNLPGWVLGLANAAIILVVYGLLGLAGFWLARRVGLPGIFREGAGWRRWVVLPLLIGAVAGLVLVVVDQIFAPYIQWSGFSHPKFPLSIVASGTAGIGEEILFRLFVMSLWAFLVNLILRRWQATRAALWFGNLIAALAFSAGHLPAAMFLAGVTTPAALPALVLVEIFLLNSLIGLVAGERFMKDGLVAAVGVHFWADIVWHVIFPLVAG